MTYWRMQMHPASPSEAVKHTIESLAAGFVGLDFQTDVGDLFRAEQSQLVPRQKDYWAFAHEMAIGDLVLIVAHHFPVALCTIDGEYNYIRSPVPEIGVWFRHFRKVSQVRYYADFVTNAREWERTTMTDTISPLRDSTKISYRLIEQWNNS